MKTSTRGTLIAAAVVILLAAGLAYEATTTRPVRQAVQAYAELISTANRPDISEAERIAAAGRLCTNRYLAIHPLSVAPEGGLVGLPRTINKNFQAWREGESIWICPSNRIGPVYQFVTERGNWRFDGLVGYLRPRGEFVPAAALSEPDLLP